MANEFLMEHFTQRELKEDLDTAFYDFDSVILRFEKTDGSVREMISTKMTKHIPENQRPTGKGSPKSDEVYPVYDLQAEGWRSFRLDKLISFKG